MASAKLAAVESKTCFICIAFLLGSWSVRPEHIRSNLVEANSKLLWEAWRHNVPETVPLIHRIARHGIKQPSVMSLTSRLYCL